MDLRQKLYIIMKGLNPLTNTCYMDSVVMSLLHRKNGVFVRNFLNSENEIATVLRQYYDKIHNCNTDDEINCESLKNACNTIQKQKAGVFPNYKGDQPQDAEEFLQFIFNEIAYEQVTYTLEIDTMYQYTNTTTGNEITKIRTAKENVPIYAFTPTTNLAVVDFADPEKCISLSKLINRGNILSHTNVKVTEDGKDFDQILTQTKINTGTYVIITIPRLTLVEPEFAPTKKTQDIVPDEKITLGGSELILTSVIAHLGCHDSGHYVCFLNNNGVWYLYDSSMYRVSNEFLEIGDFEKVLCVSCGNDRIIQSCGTILFYESVD